MKNLSVISVLIFFVFGCKIPKYTHFSLRNSLWKNNGELKTAGYYFCDFEGGKQGSLKNKASLDVLIFFDNGTCCNLSEWFSSQQEIKEYLNTHRSDLGRKDKYAYWGKYKVEKNEIFIEYFFYNPVKTNLGIYRSFGSLCGDDCFIIKESFMVKDNPIRTDTAHHVYEFVPMQQKPDSTNWMMKKRWFKIIP